jgi:Ni,Fe-hydrogenase III small subunit/NAD-dependent dihydropyrimidine dehydrogenase PreA subunit
MIWWILRGLRKGIVTTKYPAIAEPAPAGFRGNVVVRDREAGKRSYENLCPTDAIAVDGEGRIALDARRCILCGACVTAAPDVFRFEAAYETATAPDDARASLAQQARALKRSIHIRHVDAGSDGAEEWEIAALTNPYYDMQRLGLYFTLAPRHADVLLVTGVATPSMIEPLRRAYEAMPFPKAVVAAGTDACSGGFAAAGEEWMRGVDTILPVDVYVPGSPPAPIALLDGLLLAAGIVTRTAAA